MMVFTVIGYNLTTVNVFTIKTTKLKPIPGQTPDKQHLAPPQNYPQGDLYYCSFRNPGCLKI